MQAIVWKDESLGAEFEYTDIPADLADKAAEYREKLSRPLSKWTTTRWKHISKVQSLTKLH